MKKANQDKKSILDLLTGKALIKRQALKATEKAFANLKIILSQVQQELNAEMKSQGMELVANFKDRGIFEAEFNVEEDTLIFLMHSNAFTFPLEHSIWKNTYVKKDPQRTFCGMISVYNFLSDSFRYDRKNDLGYLIARIYINADNHYFIEGRPVMNFTMKDFNKAVMDVASIKKLIEVLIQFSLDFDMLAPAFEEQEVLSVDDIISSSGYSSFASGKRLGFRVNNAD